jgi:hypothetical protein
MVNPSFSAEKKEDEPRKIEFPKDALKSAKIAMAQFVKDQTKDDTINFHVVIT